MRSSSGSVGEEGEIVETEVEKAPPSLPSVAGPSVDRHSSRPRGSVSPALSYTDSRPPRSNSRHRDRHERTDSRRQSREPPRGEKRRHSEEDDDPRRHKVHYEAHGGPNIRRARVSYADIDHTEPKEMFPSDFDAKGRGDNRRFRGDTPGGIKDRDWHYREDRRSRSRSRSPPRASGARAGYAQVAGGDNYREDDRNRHQVKAMGGYANGTKTPHSRPLNDRRERLVPHERSRREAEFNSKLPEHQAGSIQSTRNGQKGPRDVVGGAPKEPVKLEDPVDEAKLIEERRKQREALMAKYRGQATPLLVSVLGIKDSPKEYPVQSPADAPDVFNSPSSPALHMSPREGTPGGVFTIAKDTAATDHHGEDVADEPSAADYDPTMDMQEDNQRHEQRIHAQDASIPSDQDGVHVATHESDAQKPVSAAKADEDDFDMFADVDDSEVLAEPIVKPKRPEPKPVDILPALAAAKQLDASLLDNWDDAEGYYKVIPGELLDNRYRVQTGGGKGMFSCVVRATDMNTNRDVAIKIIRNNETMRKAGMKEIDILHKLCTADPDDKKHVVRLERYFDHKSHLCIVFENLNIDLRGVLKKPGIRDVGISLKAVRAYAHQMFLGLSLLRKCNILHADLKPDNVLVNETQSVLKICDLGSASDAAENEITPYLVSRFYRAPEIILGVPYDFAIDMWSIGCTLYELYTGKILFTGRTNNQMLRSIMECRGKFSHKLLKRGQFTHLHFDELLNFRSVETDKITGRDIVRTMTFNRPTRELKTRLLSAASGSESEMKDLNLFVDLLDRCLNLNPEKRCTPAEALKHPFIHRIR